MKLSRRHVLRGAGAVLALPLLDAMNARADTLPPKRFVTFYTPNGTVYSRWAPSGMGSTFTLSPILSPLEPHKNQLVIATNLDCTSAEHGDGDGHQRGIGHLWTGTELQPGTLFGHVDWAGGASVDQLVADQLGRTTTLRSLELGVQVAGARVYDRMAYRAAGQPLPPELDPAAVFNRLFGADEDPAAAALRRARRKSVLDVVLGEYSALSGRVGRADQRRLDAHATTVRELEQRIDAAARSAMNCVRPTAPSVPDLTAGSNYPELGRLQLDLLVLALACDLTRVASLQWSNGAGDVVFSWLGLSVGHHELSHRDDTDTAAQQGLEAISTWYSTQFRGLLDRLSAVQEQGGTLLDSTLVAWGNDLGKGNVHGHTSVPFVLAGGAQGTVRTGQVIDAQHAPHNALLLSCAQAMGVGLTFFGNSAYCPGPLPGVLR